VDVAWNGDEVLSAAINGYLAQISQEVLALSIHQDSNLSAGENEIGLALRVTKVLTEK
jgi:hypothetical protein